MAKFSIQLLGDRELERALSEMTDKLERKVLAGAFRQTAQTVLKAAQANLTQHPVILDPGISKAKTRRLMKLAARFAARRMGLKVQALRRRKGRVGYSVVTGTRAELGIRNQFYPPAHLEWGHAAPHRSSRSLTSRLYRARTRGAGRRTPPHAYLRPALKGNEAQLKRQLTDAIRSGIERELAKDK